jgi:O-antigen/teichoic acid export membrane protein
MNNKKNAFSAIIVQCVTTIQGLILPRLILATFGSDVNGLINSITQFLGFISLLEGGLGAVVLAELYRPIEDNDEDKIRMILQACQAFFNQISIVFIGYTIILAIAYPIIVKKEFSFGYAASMVMILSLVTLSQNLFSITYRLFLQADQKLYIVNNISSITIAINTFSAAIIIFIFPNIHVVKLCSGIIYLLQPLAYRRFINSKYRLKAGFKIRVPKGVLSNRWSGFWQNLAHFINMNTDVAVLTLFTSLGTVSIYTVYLMAITALRGVLASFGNSYQSALGKYIAEDNFEILSNKFSEFERVFWFISIIVFSTCLLLINPFVKLYTTGIHDENYYQPVFAAIIVLANLVYTIREPYRLLILAAGKFKETNFGSTIEALLNLGISVILVWKFGLIGVAIGTLIAITFRFIYFMWFLKRNIIFRKYKSYFTYIITSLVVYLCNSYIYINNVIKVNSLIGFCGYGFLILSVNSLLCLGIYYGIEFIKKTFSKCNISLQYLLFRRKKR